MTIEKREKQPREVLDFDFMAARPLAPDDTIASVTATYTGPDTTLVIERALPLDDTTAKVWLSGGTNGATYKITTLINSTAGRVIEGEFLLHVKDR